MACSCSCMYWLHFFLPFTHAIRFAFHGMMWLLVPRQPRVADFAMIKVMILVIRLTGVSMPLHKFDVLVCLPHCHFSSLPTHPCLASLPALISMTVPQIGTACASERNSLPCPISIYLPFVFSHARKMLFRHLEVSSCRWCYCRTPRPFVTGQQHAIAELVLTGDPLLPVIITR